jgi:hypothetical protein
MSEVLEPKAKTATPRAPMPSPPVRQYSFTSFQTNNPTAPPPGDRMDAEYDRANASITSTITWANTSLNTNGTIRDGVVGKNQLAPGLFDDVADDIIADVQPMVDEANSYASSAFSSASQSAASASSAAGHSAAAQGAAGTANTASTSAQASASTANGAATAAQNSASAAANSANHASGDAALAEDWGLVARDWAEHMPDTIPPNTLAVMGVTGDHWSSRWWANRVIGYGDDVIERIERLYLGAFPIPPTSDSSGNPIAIGALYYDLTLGAMYVWNGSSWQPISTPSPTQTYRTIFVATAGQTVFEGGDRDGLPLVYNPAANQQVAVFKRGTLLTPTNDYVATVNKVTLNVGATAGDIVQVWVENIPTVKLDWRTARVDVSTWVFNGSQTSFVLRDSAGATLVMASASDLMLSLDGVWQQAFVDYTVSSSTLVFGTAPPSSARVFGIAIVPVPDVPTPQPGVSTIDTATWVFNGTNVTFPILSGGNPIVPVTSANLLVSLAGVWQAAELDYTVSGSTITFAAPPAPDTKAFGVVGLPAFEG